MEKSATAPSSSIIGGRWSLAVPEDDDEKMFHEKPLLCPEHRHRQARISKTGHALLLMARSICHRSERADLGDLIHRLIAVQNPPCQ
jgi:hypothetical protein